MFFLLFSWYAFMKFHPGPPASSPIIFANWGYEESRSKDALGLCHWDLIKIRMRGHAVDFFWGVPMWVTDPPVIDIAMEKNICLPILVWSIYTYMAFVIVNTAVFKYQRVYKFIRSVFLIS